MKKRIMSLLLAILIVVGMMPSMAQNAYASTDIYTKLMNDATVVKFNDYNWYIIKDDSTATGGTVTLLAADKSFGDSTFNGGRNTAYNGSIVQGKLNALTAEGGAFASVKDAIADTNLNDVGVTGAKLYLLNNTEAIPTTTKYTTQSMSWWLRTPGTGVGCVMYAYRGGIFDSGDEVYHERLVRPALRLNLSNVIFDPETNTFSVKPPHDHSFTYSADGPTITATCANTDGNCPLTDCKATLTIAAEGGTYDGTTSFGATITDENSIQGDAKVKYQKKTSESSYDTETETAPTDAGDYKASITLGPGTDEETATASVEYTIAKADITPVVNIEGWDYGSDPNTPSVTAESNPGGGEVTYKYYTDEECTKETTSAQGATKDGGVPSYGGDYWAKATVAETANYNSGTGKKGFKINATAVTVTGLDFDSKIYDGTTSATLDTTHAELVGVKDGDVVSIKSATGTFNDKNVGTGKTISSITIVLEGKDAGGYKATADPLTTTGAITARSVTVSGITASNKTYDGNTTAELTFTGASLEGKVTGDTLSVKGKESQTGTFNNKNVGTGKKVTLPELVLDGADAGNYSIKNDSQTTATADITQRTITVSSGITSAGKVYDGTTTAPLDTSNAVLTGKVGDDDLAVTANGTFGSKDAGTAKEIAISGLELTGAEKDNYVLAGSGHQATTTGDITQKEAELEWTDTELTYNGKAQKPKASVSNLVNGDECTVTVDGEQTDANAKSGKDSYTATAASLSNANYKLPDNTTTEFTIVPKKLTQAMISLDDDTFKHDGTEKSPAVSMTDPDILEEDAPKQMKVDEDYTLSGDVSSSDLGTHFITAKGEGNYTGTIDTSWMIYNNKSGEDKEERTGDKGDFEVFVDIENNTSTLTVDNLNISMAKGFLTQEDMVRYNSGENVLVYMIFKEQPESEVESTDSSLLGGLFRTEGATDISWYDITVWKKIGSSAATKVHDTKDELSMGVEVPDKYKNAPEGYTREFYLGRAHDGASKLLAQTSEVKVGFGSSKFSTYALAYKDTAKPKPDPGKDDKKGKGGTNTGDPNDLAGLIALMLASGGALGAMGYRRRKEH